MKRILVTLFIVIITTSSAFSNDIWSKLAGPYGSSVSAMIYHNGNYFISSSLNQSYGGVWKSTNGSSWTDVSAGLPIPRAHSFAQNGSTLYASSDTNVMMTTNGGTTWTDISGNLPIWSFPQEMIFYNGILFCAVWQSAGYHEVFYTSNNGTTWTTTGFTMANGIQDFSNWGSELWAATANGIYLSTDNGLTWNSQSTNIPFAASCYSIVAHGDTLYAGTSYGMYLTTNGGALWMPATNGLPSSTCYGNDFVILGNIVYAGTTIDGVYQTILGTNNWSKTGTGIPNYTFVNCMASNGTALAAGSYEGFLYNNPAGGTWTLSNNGITSAYVRCVYTEGNVILAGCYYGMQRSTDGGNTWSQVTLPASTYVSKFIKSGASLFACTNSGIYSSANIGSTWTLSNTGFSGTPYCIAFNGVKYFAGGSGGLFSAIPGNNWTAVSGPWSSIYGIAVNGAQIYVSAGNKIYRSDDGGVNWADDSNGIPASNPYLMDITVNDGCVFVSSGYGVYRKLPYATTWTSGTGTKPYYADDLITSGRMLIATASSDVYISDDNAKTWHYWNEGFDSYIGSKFRMCADAMTLYAGTEQGGTWKRSLVPEIYTQPISGAPFCASGTFNVNFTSSATFNAGNKFIVQLSDSAGHFSNPLKLDSITATTPAPIVVTIPSNVPEGLHYRVRVVSTNPFVISEDNGTDLIIYSKLAIQLQPANQNTCAGAGSGFYCGATGSGITYQWQMDSGGGFSNLSNNATYQGVNEEILLISNVTIGMNGYKYRCYLTGNCPPSLTSNFGTLNVGAAPIVNTQPANQTVCSTSATFFNVSATGSGLTYRWQLDNGSGMFSDLSNGAPYSGVTTNTLSISSATATMNGYQYRCLLSGCMPTDEALLTVSGTATVLNTVQNVTVCNGGTASYTVSVPGANIGYQWEEDNGGGFVSIINGGIYSGANSKTLTLTNVTAGMSGYQYRCQTSALCAPTTSLSNAATLTIGAPPSISMQPVNTSSCAQNDVIFRVTASGTPLSYQWMGNSGSGWNYLVNIPPFSGVNNDTLFIDTVSTSLNGMRFRCRISSCTLSDSATLTVNATPSVTLSSFPILCHDDPALILSQGSPSGGTYYGTGISTNMFYPSVTGPGTFPITYYYTNGSGCTSSATQSITVTYCTTDGEIITGIEDGILLYPNPASQSITVERIISTDDAELFIINSIGEIVVRQKINKAESKAVINVSSMPAGIYFVRTGKYSGRFVKSN
ncbi:MAG: T9SS type A sorting domain-containing protein [Bacteroidota bacterium]